MSDDLLSQLNAEQKEAVERTEGYVCLHAGAGTGKTRTLTYRYAYLVRDYGISPRAIWCVTFTNKAADEMKRRVNFLCGAAVGNPFITTFHSFCATFLREEISAVGWPSTFLISDVSDVKELLRPLYKELEIDGKEFPLNKAWAFIDGFKESEDYVPALIGPDSSEILRRVEEATEAQHKLFWRYLFAQRSIYTLDFDDLILLTLHILRHFKDIREKWQRRFEYILVDEFQDIDRDQYALVDLLAAGNNNLFVVGDPDQTIYSFRGARVEYFNNFVEDHSPNAQRLFLTQNYRSTQQILTASYSLISYNQDEERRPLQAMRQDITPEMMISVKDPARRRKMPLNAQVQNTINERSYYHDLLPVLGEYISVDPDPMVDQSTAGDVTVTATSSPTMTPPVTIAANVSAVADTEGVVSGVGMQRLLPVMVHAPNVYAEADYVADSINRIRAIEPKASIAVLYRAHYLSLNIENALLANHIQYNVVGEVRFFDRREIRDVLAYMRLRINLNDDMALRRVINVPRRQFGPKRMEYLERLARKSQQSLFVTLQNNRNDEFLFKSTSVGQFVDVMAKLSAEPFHDPSYDFELLLSQSGYEEDLKRNGEDERVDNIRSLKGYVHEFAKSQEETVNLADFVNNVSLLTSADEDLSLKDTTVRLMTVHNAKGLEFDYVFVVSVNEAVFPSKKSINEQHVEEERRLMYVAMTRAKKQLFMSEAGGLQEHQNSQSNGAKLPRLPSRFLHELPPEQYLEVGHSLAEEELRAAERAAAALGLKGGYARVAAADAEAAKSISSSGIQVGDRVFHRIFSEGTVREIRLNSGEIVVFFDKLNRERTLSNVDALQKIGGSSTAMLNPATPQQEAAALDDNSSALKVNDHVSHKAFGTGVVREILYATEAVVFFEKLGRERTLSINAIEKLAASAPSQAQAPAPASAQAQAPDSAQAPVTVSTAPAPAPVHVYSYAPVPEPVTAPVPPTIGSAWSVPPRMTDPVATAPVSASPVSQPVLTTANATATDAATAAVATDITAPAPTAEVVVKPLEPAPQKTWDELMQELSKAFNEDFGHKRSDD